MTVASDNVIDHMPVMGSPWNVVVSANQRSLYVGFDDATLREYDLATKTEARRAAGVPALHLIGNAAGTRLFAAGASTSVQEIDIATFTRVRGFSGSGDRTYQAIVLSLNETHLCAASEAPHFVDEVSLATGGVVRSISTPNCGGWGLGITPDDRDIYLSCPSSGRTISYARNSGIERLRYEGVGEVRRIAVSADGLAVFVAAGGRGLFIIR